MNYVILSGRLTRDTELCNTQGGTGYLRNALAVKSDFKNKDGEYPSNFFNFCAFGKTAEVIANYCNKGSLILVKGHLTNNTMMNDKGQNCTIIDLIVDNVELVEPKKQQQAPQNNNYNGYQNNNYKNDDDPFKDLQPQMDLDPDSLPF